MQEKENELQIKIEQLKKSEERFRDMSLSSADWVWEVDKDGKYVFVSGNVKEILGYSSEELIGKNPFDLMPKEEAKKIREIFREISSEKKPIVDLKNWNISKDGREVLLLTNGIPVLNERGELQGYRGVDKDITEKNKAEQLERSQKILTQAIQGSATPTFIIDKDHKITHWNTACERIFGVSAKGLVGTERQWSTFYPDKERPVMADLVLEKAPIEEYDKWYSKDSRPFHRKSKLVDDAREAIDFFPHLGKNGKWIFFTAAPLKDEKGEIIGAIETLQDITEQKKVEELEKMNKLMVGRELKMIELKEKIKKLERQCLKNNV